MNLQTSLGAAPRLPIELMMPPEAAEAPDFEGVVLRHLKTPSEIKAVLHLREEIDLSVHASASSDFVALEKKETNWGSSSLSSSMAC